MRHTFIVSDIHLSEAEPPHPENPLWKRFKRPKLFVDRTFKKYVDHILELAGDEPAELVLNGDIFDFDSVLDIPENPPFKVNWLERKRGLSSSEAKSKYKMSVILDDHTVWVESLRDFIIKGNKVVFAIGNHDMELHWPAVQEEVMRHLKLPKKFEEFVIFCEWFYVSEGDTLIEHGNQYDAYCLCNNPINPLIKRLGQSYVRLPFGNLAGKLMLNGMGLFNPHVESSFIKSTLKEYFVFFYKYLFRSQPLLLWTWFWSAGVTLAYSLREGLLPALKDPLTFEARVEEIAKKSNAHPRLVRALFQLHVHPAIYNPFKIMRELWLDRALLMLFILFISFQIFTFINLFVPVSIWVMFIPFALILPAFIFYAKQVKSDVYEVQKVAFRKMGLISKLAGVKRIIHGHTHREVHGWIKDIEYLNTGTWSPAYKDVECTKPFGKKCFVWIKPAGDKRIAELYEWKDPDKELIADQGEGAKKLLKLVSSPQAIPEDLDDKAVAKNEPH